MSKAVHRRSRAVPLPAALLIGALLTGQTGAAELSVESQPAAEGPATAYYRWIDGGGRIQYTDFEPVGVPSERIPLDPETDDSPMLTSAGTSRPSDPFHDQDQQVVPIEHIGPCADARRQLGILHAALPVYMDETGNYRNAWRGDEYKGVRSYLDAEARTEAMAGVRNTVLEHCSDPEAFAREEAAFKEELGRK